MREQLFEELAKKYPDLFQKARAEYFETNDGWYNIIDVLCGMISKDVDQLRKKLAHYNSKGDHDRAAEVTIRLDKEIEKLPMIVQVKEKYGTLRFYYYGGTEEMEHYVSMAEHMSAVTCEECGAPGKERPGSWIKTLCDLHARVQKSNEIEFHYAMNTRPGPILSDEE